MAVLSIVKQQLSNIFSGNHRSSSGERMCILDMLEIRGLTLEDIDPILAIYSQIIGQPADDDFKQFIVHQVAQKENISLVAVIQGKVAGYMISSFHSGIFGMPRSAWISALGVHPQYMGQGIGEKLGRKILQEYQQAGIREVYTSVRWDSADILSFFKNLGFEHSSFINLRKSLE